MDTHFNCTSHLLVSFFKLGLLAVKNVTNNFKVMSLLASAVTLVKKKEVFRARQRLKSCLEPPVYKARSGTTVLRFTGVSDAPRYGMPTGSKRDVS